MRVTWGALFILLCIVAIILFLIKVFIWEIIGIAAFVALIIYIWKRFGKNR